MRHIKKSSVAVALWPVALFSATGARSWAATTPIGSNRNDPGDWPRKQYLHRVPNPESNRLRCRREGRRAVTLGGC